jgi:hypothetical protein
LLRKLNLLLCEYISSRGTEIGNDRLGAYLSSGHPNAIQRRVE